VKIVLATHNSDKVREITRILTGLRVTLVALDEFDGVPEVVEDGCTLEQNALKKARAVRDATGWSALADDTGLEVDALDGAPGIFAARYAGDGATYADNCRKLLDALRGVAIAERSARFRTVVALALDPVASTRAGGRDAIVAEGILPGTITLSARGDDGFGYDPVFYVPEAAKTLAQMTLADKNTISHRYRALVEIREAALRDGLVGEITQ